MPSAYESAAFMIDLLLVWQNIAVADATAAQRADALTKINMAYREVCQGGYTDEAGRTQFHTWGFLQTEDSTTHAFAQDAYVDDMPSGWWGQVEAAKFQYSATASKAEMELVCISPSELLEKRRDSTTSGTPEFCTVRHKSFSASGGSVYELAIHPPTDAAITLTTRYRTLPAALTDSTSVFPRGPEGMADLIVQRAKAREERYRGQTDGPSGGPENREADRMMLRMIQFDKTALPDAREQTSYSECDLGLGI